METTNTIGSPEKIMVILLKDFASHTATSLSKKLKMSRWGAWKILKKLGKEELIAVEPIGKGKTSTYTVRLNWENVLVDKILALALTQEALRYRRWVHNFSALEKEVDFLILYGSILYAKEANDIDIMGVANEKKLSKIQDMIFKIQQTQAKKIHSINLTKEEFEKELKSANKAYLDAVKKGIVLFGQENFIKFIRGLQK